MKYEIPVVVGVDWEGIDSIPPSSSTAGPGRRADRLFYITARFNRALETMVRRSPEQYLWIHRRWKSRPKWERREAHARLAPSPTESSWMDDATMKDLIANSEPGMAEKPGS